jgi:acyl carrier protein
MTIEEKKVLLAETMDIDATELTPETELADLEMWDSMTRLAIIVMMDDEFGKELKGEQIRTFKTVQDIIDFMG